VNSGNSGGAGSGGDDGDSALTEALAGLRAQWVEMERRLYPLATTSTELYTGAVEVIRSIGSELSAIDSHADLVNRWSMRADVLAAAEANDPQPLPAGVPVDQLLGAAFALRDRALVTERDQADRRSRIEEARAAGAVWARLHETGDLGRGLAGGYQSIEMHLASGLALVSTVEQDPVTGGPNYVAAVFRMDEFGGEILEMRVDGYEDRETPDVEEFPANQAALRHAVEDA